MGNTLPPLSTAADVDAAARAAQAAFASFGASSAATRAALLRGLAEALESNRERLVALADSETNLGPGRLNGELDRTAFQLRGFATQVEQGAAFAFTDDPAVAGAPPAGHPAMVRQRVPLGPVAMFSASNFPFAFSVLGGDTASALAAGCPVVVKAHPGHPRLSREVAALAHGVVAAQGLPAGVFSMVEGAGHEAVGADVGGGDLFAEAVDLLVALADGGVELFDFRLGQGDLALALLVERGQLLLEVGDLRGPRLAEVLLFGVADRKSVV